MNTTKCINDRLSNDLWAEAMQYAAIIITVASGAFFRFHGFVPDASKWLPFGTDVWFLNKVPGKLSPVSQQGVCLGPAVVFYRNGPVATTISGQ
jgi:hypothetical protein